MPSRDGHFTDNLIAFRSDEMTAPVNIGPDTDPGTFVLARNAWYCLDEPAQSRPRLPIPEEDGGYRVEPGFRDAARGDLRLRPDSPISGGGARRDGLTALEAEGKGRSDVSDAVRERSPRR